MTGTTGFELIPTPQTRWGKYQSAAEPPTLPTSDCITKTDRDGSLNVLPSLPTTSTYIQSPSTTQAAS